MYGELYNLTLNMYTQHLVKASDEHGIHSACQHDWSVCWCRWQFLGTRCTCM